MTTREAVLPPASRLRHQTRSTTGNHFFFSRSSSWIIWNTFVAKSGSLGFLSGCHLLYNAWSSRFLVPGDDARNARISFRTDWKTCSCTSPCEGAGRCFSRGPHADAHRGRFFGRCGGSLYSFRSGCFHSSPGLRPACGAGGGFRGEGPAAPPAAAARAAAPGSGGAGPPGDSGGAAFRGGDR